MRAARGEPLGTDTAPCNGCGRAGGGAGTRRKPGASTKSRNVSERAGELDAFPDFDSLALSGPGRSAYGDQPNHPNRTTITPVITSLVALSVQLVLSRTKRCVRGGPWFLFIDSVTRARRDNFLKVEFTVHAGHEHFRHTRAHRYKKTKKNHNHPMSSAPGSTPSSKPMVRESSQSTTTFRIRWRKRVVEGKKEWKESRAPTGKGCQKHTQTGRAGGRPRTRIQFQVGVSAQAIRLLRTSLR